MTESAETYSTMQPASELTSASLRVFNFPKDVQVVGIPSSMCYALPVDKNRGLERASKSLAFSLEESLPLDAEQMSFWVGSRLIVVADGEAIDALLKQEGTVRKHVIAVTPTVLLAAQGLLDRYREKGRLVIIEHSGQSADVMLAERGELCQWRWVDSDSIVDIIRPWSEEQESPLKVIEIRDTIDREPIGETLGDRCELVTDGTLAEEWIAETAERLGRGQWSPLVSFGNGPLSRVNILAPLAGTMRLATVAVILALLSICVGLNWRAAEYRARANELTESQATHFSRLFPKQRVPTGVLSRVESEYRRLSATKGSEGADVPSFGSVLPVMAAFWRGLPADLMLEIEVLHFAPSQLRSISGSAKTFADLESLSQSLMDEGFEVQPVSATQDARGVSLQWDAVSWRDKP